ncbi:YisL family protein [Sporosarcina sp. BI001-red]|uniref:YisL family protein n=1 Tax=Sporosarcina sp. BI001-red TaxID=2282866 RepID=UPI00351A744F
MNNLEILTSSTHLHIFSWVVGIILFVIATGQPLDSKGRKVLKMVLRVFYILIIVTGVALFIKLMSGDAALYGVKFIFGILTIGMMEMVLARQAKNKPTQLFWILFIISVLVTVGLGFHLPFGIQLF